jgi:signal transduction histidine kinase
MRFARPWRRSLGARLLATFLAGLLVSVAAISAGVLVRLYLLTEDSSEDALVDQADWLARHLVFDALGRPSDLAGEAADARWVFEGLKDDFKYRVLDADGTVVLSSEPGGGPLAAPGRPFDARLQRFTMQADGGVTLRALTERIEHDGRPYYIQTARSARAANLIRRNVGLKLLKSGVFWTVTVSLLVLTVAGYLTLRHMLRPLHEASAAAARIGPRSIGTRLATQSLPTELVPMVEAFNQALDRLERGYLVQQEFLASAAHELKTPLALIRAQVEIDGVGDRHALLRDIDFMARQVQQLLHLAEVSEPRNYVFEPIDVGSIAGEVAGYLGRLAERRAVRLELDLATPAGPLQLQADRGALFILLKNLVENALQHTPSGAAVCVKASAEGLSVHDEGAGIAAEHLPKLFNRFWRGPQRRDEGAGLGLAICHEIAVAHGWDLSAHNGTRGAEFRLRFGAVNAVGSV